MSGGDRLKLIEHSLPLEAINAASSREKSVRHGHPSTLHLWWARRPLAACRAVLFAQLVDDPSAWPGRFPTEEDQAKERRRLHKIIEDMVEWPKSDAKDRRRFERAIEAARYEIARSVAWGFGEEPPDHPSLVLDYLQEKGPPIYDPFCGGGSIPLEAQRLGLRAYGSDLNPVAVLITKALIEFPPKFAGLPPVHPSTGYDKNLADREWKGAQGLAEDVRRYGKWMRDEAEKRIGHLYPQAPLPDGSKATVIAWLWVRTVASPDPSQRGAHVPLASSFVLSSKPGKEAIVIPAKDAGAKDGWRFILKTDGVTKEELEIAEHGTKAAQGSFRCLLSGARVQYAYADDEANAGRMRARLMAIVAEGERSRVYLPPSEEQEQVALAVQPDYRPEEPARGTFASNAQGRVYGFRSFGDYFSPRQLAVLTTFSELIPETRARVLADALACSKWAQYPDPNERLATGGAGPAAYADAVVTYLGFTISKLANLGSSLTSWMSDRGAFRETFARQGIPMVWDFAEANFFASTGASYRTILDKVASAVAEASTIQAFATAVDAPRNNYPIRPAVISTDPPYYDNISYADLSDFFYVWLRRTLGEAHPSLFRRLLVPKNEELVAERYRHGGQPEADRHFMDGMEAALSAMSAASVDAPMAIYYAFKQSEIRSDGIFSPGWASFLQAVVNAGLQVDGTWPIRTESSGRIVANGTNALASSVVLVCRSRSKDAKVASARDFQRELKTVMRQAIVDHQKAGVPLPDRRQAAIGPGIGIFSQYAWVRETDDSKMSVAKALALINREIDEALSEGTEALDAETRFALEWYQINGYRLVPGGAGSAISMLQGFNLAESRMNASGLFRARGGDAKLLTREEMGEADPHWAPSHDDTLTVWEIAQHLARVFHAEEGGIDKAGRLFAESRRSGPEVLLVAERLFDIATDKGDSDEALVWNQLQTAWPEIERAADRAEEAGVRPATVQAQFDFPEVPKEPR
jgi:putative DNA methylase